MFEDMNLNRVREIAVGLMVEGLPFYCNVKFEEFHVNQGYFCPGIVRSIQEGHSAVRPDRKRVF